MQEIDIIELCKNGDKESFSLLYDLYFNKIYNFVYYKTSHKETTEDLVSVTFLKALEKINKFKSNKGTFQAWLFRIARNTVIDYYRKRKTVYDISDVWDFKSNDNFLKDIQQKKEVEKIIEFMKTLTSMQREIIILRIWENMSYKDIAEIMGKSEASCKMLFKRSIEIIKKEIPLFIILFLLMKTNL